MLSKYLLRRPISALLSTTPRAFGTLGLSEISQDLKGRNVFVRVDFNVPLDKETGSINDDTRIVAALPTIKFLQENGAKSILCSHMGRPKGKVNSSMSLQPVAERLSGLISSPVRFADDCVGPSVRAQVEEMSDGEVLLLENVRFYGEETENDPEFSKQLASDCSVDVYVNDAFGTAHRAHASTNGIVKHVSQKFPGFLLQKEIKYLGGVVDSPSRPFSAIVGGSKVSSKLPLLQNLISNVDKLFIGGAMMFTFYRALGLDTGNSLVEDDQIDVAREIIRLAEEQNVELHLPSDVVVSSTFEADAEFHVVEADKIPDGMLGMDIGPDSVRSFEENLKGSGTIVWNGPMGVFEMDQFAKGTLGVTQAVADCTSEGTVSIAGGGDVVAAVKKSGLENSFSHISTGGGASLEMLEGKILPGIDILNS